MYFSQEHHVDPRVHKTREAIRNTFKKKICEMPAEKITVKELTDRAKIHRKTFYLHYTTLSGYDVRNCRWILSGNGKT